MTRAALILVGVAGCGQSAGAPVHQPAGRGREPVVWVYRRLDTGMLSAESTLATYTLTREGDRATLVIETRRAKDPDPEAPEITGWQPGNTQVLSGAARRQGAGWLFELAGERAPIKLRCTTAAIAAAPATATRMRSSTEGGDCGDPGRWSESSATPVTILSCSDTTQPPPDPSSRAGAPHDLAFAAAPGIEYLWVNDDCVMQGGGYRLIAVDGSIARIRPN